MTDILWTTLRIVIMVYIGFSAYLFVMQAKYVYFPDRLVDATPALAGMAFESVSLQSGEETVSAWFVPAPAAGEPRDAAADVADMAVLICHGNAGDMGDRIGTIETFHRLGFNVLIFDYRGYGLSSGKPTEAGTYADAASAWAYLTEERGFAPERIVVFGRSLGAGVASWLAARHAPGLLVLESAFTSVPEMGAVVYPLLPVRWLCRIKYDSAARMADIRCPVVVAHSPEDRTVPFRFGERLYELANEPKLFVEMSGGHNSGGLDIDPDYQRRLVEFLAAHRTVRR
jgi:fermentation-respiration switch protein FrsA (DUF1100 family)